MSMSMFTDVDKAPHTRLTPIKTIRVTLASPNLHPKSRYSPLLPIDCLAAAILITLVWSVLSNKPFSADGASFFIEILRSRDVSHIAWSRQFSYDLGQWPIVLALHCGLENATLLRFIFGLGYLLPFIFAYLIVRMQVKKGAPVALLPAFLFGMLSITLPNDFLLIGESQFLLPLAWPMLAYLLQPGRFSATAWLLPVALSVLLTRMYETQAVTLALFGLILLTRSRAHLTALVRQQRYVTLSLLGLCIALWALGAAIAAYWIIYPRDLANRGAFLHGIQHTGQNPVLGASMLAALCFVIGLRKPKARAALGTVLVAISYLCWRERFDLFNAHISFDSRVLTLLWLPPLIALSVWGGEARKVTFGAALWFAVVSIAPLAVDLAGTDVWRDYAGQVTDWAARRDDGLVPASVHRLDQHPASWNWTFPSLSIALGAPHVGSVLENAPDVAWQPFNPATELPLAAFAGYRGTLARR
ncbi:MULTISPECIES: hypothetical protein [unclassified Paraburkholderia]|uniref:hypothetical protein n=1 Tax=unclassified Paraburkholderia TaxID=2615204 RepID=UPI000E364CA3|nr:MULTISPECIES: hypothetical protein [unclassified Paraburkholderia]REE22625.1 hypothetical protein B0G71_5842 [Paraburkholderia sp. BL27I4N3]RKR36821.1 hypothetical protein B0G82_4871 [Paraburkholderia sp. BL17N1]